MKQDLYVLYVGHTLFYFGNLSHARDAVAALTHAMVADGAADPNNPELKIYLCGVTPRLERIRVDVPRRTLRAHGITQKTVGGMRQELIDDCRLATGDCNGGVP
ncbi:MAG: hypothetical protein WCR06_07695 [bacterium]